MENLKIFKCSCGKDPVIKELKLKGSDYIWRYLIVCCDRVYKGKLKDAVKIWNIRRLNEKNNRKSKREVVFSK